MGDTWVYRHQDLGEPVHVDGSPILRPVVPLIMADVLPAVLGVLDSGSWPVDCVSDSFSKPLGQHPARPLGGGMPLQIDSPSTKPPSLI